MWRSVALLLLFFPVWFLFKTRLGKRIAFQGYLCFTSIPLVFCFLFFCFYFFWAFSSVSQSSEHGISHGPDFYLLLPHHTSFFSVTPSLPTLDRSCNLHTLSLIFSRRLCCPSLIHLILLLRDSIPFVPLGLQSGLILPLFW